MRKYAFGAGLVVVTLAMTLFVRAFSGLRTRDQTHRVHFRNMGDGCKQVVQ